MLSACIEGVGILGPGLDGWPASAAVLRGEHTYSAARTQLPAPAALPAAERRRAGRIVRLALAIGQEAVSAARRDPQRLPSVFSSSSGDGDNCHEICLTLAGTERMLSPTRFHNSVHNAASGYWSIAHGCNEPYTALCAHDASFGAGLLESLSQLDSGTEAVLFLAYDVDYPPPMRAHRPIPDAFGVALLLSRASQSAGKAQLRAQFSADSATLMSEPPLERLRREIPSARGLPLLAQLAAGRTDGPVVLEYLEDLRLQVELRV